MKLHMPKNLRSALLSAALVVSAATPSFAAITPWNITYDEGQQYATVGGDKRLEFELSGVWNNAWSIVFSAEASSLQGTLTLLGVRGANILAEGITMAGGSLTLSVTNGSPQSVPVSEKFASCENITFVVSRNGDGANNLSLRAYDSGDLSTPLYELKGNKAQNWSKGNLQGVVFGGKGSYTAGSNVSFVDDGDVGSYHMTKAGYTYGSRASFADLVNYLYGSARTSLTWSGGTNGNWSSDSWSTASGTSGRNFTNYDSVTFATQGAEVTLDGTTSVTTATISENTTFNLNNKTLAADSLTVGNGKTLTVSGGGKLAANTISGGTIDATASSVELRGASITNATIEGSLKLVGSSRITLGGTVVLDSVVNNLTVANDNFAFVAGHDGKPSVNLTFTGTSDLTNGGDNQTSMMALRQSSITVGKGDGTEATLTTAAIQLSGERANYNASVVVKGGGTLKLVKVADNDTVDTYVNTLTNEGSPDGVKGTITSEKNIYVYANVTNNGSLAASTLKIRNATPQDAKTLTSELGGTVNVDTLMLAGGTTNISGDVTAGSVATDGTTAKTLGGTGGTLTLDGATNSTANVTLTGSFGIKKTGSAEQTFSNTSGYSGKLDVSGGTLNLANMGGNSSVTEITISGGSTLGLYKAGVATPSTAAETTVTFGEGGKLTVGEGGGTLNANVVLNSGSTLTMTSTLNLGSSLTLNGTTLDGALLKQLLSGPCTVTLFSGVDELYIGNDSTNRAAAGTDFIFSTADVNAAFALSDEVALLFAPETGNPAITVGYVADGGLIKMTSTVPEPATATLSLLALAALSARRRRK